MPGIQDILGGQESKPRRTGMTRTRKSRPVGEKFDHGDPPSLRSLEEMLFGTLDRNKNTRQQLRDARIGDIDSAHGNLAFLLQSNAERRGSPMTESEARRLAGELTPQGAVIFRPEEGSVVDALSEVSMARKLEEIRSLVGLGEGQKLGGIIRALLGRGN